MRNIKEHIFLKQEQQIFAREGLRSGLVDYLISNSNGKQIQIEEISNDNMFIKVTPIDQISVEIVAEFSYLWLSLWKHHKYRNIYT